MTDWERLQAIGDEGVHGADLRLHQRHPRRREPQRGDVAATLKELISSAKGRVAVTTFASNVSRIRSVAEAALACGREVVAVGRAMDRVIQVALECGYLEETPAFRGADAYGYLPRDKVVCLLTGSQGEPRAALARVAQDEHPDIALSPGDLVIMSSRTIPGNEKPVGRIINSLIRQGVEVITDRTHLVHVSGHPRRGELEKLYGWLRPQVALPVHGEALHMHEHAKLARSLGVPDVLMAKDGDMVLLGPRKPGVIDQVPFGRVFKDGSLLVPEGEFDRRRTPPAVVQRHRLHRARHQHEGRDAGRALHGDHRAAAGDPRRRSLRGRDRGRDLLGDRRSAPSSAGATPTSWRTPWSARYAPPSARPGQEAVLPRPCPRGVIVVV